MEKYVLRMLREYEELSIKLDKALKYFNSPITNMALDTCMREELREQILAMQQYKKALKTRLRRAGIINFKEAIRTEEYNEFVIEELERS